MYTSGAGCWIPVRMTIIIVKLIHWVLARYLQCIISIIALGQIAIPVATFFSG